MIKLHKSLQEEFETLVNRELAMNQDYKFVNFNLLTMTKIIKNCREFKEYMEEEHYYISDQKIYQRLTYNSTLEKTFEEGISIIQDLIKTGLYSVTILQCYTSIICDLVLFWYIFMDFSACCDTESEVYEYRKKLLKDSCYKKNLDNLIMCLPIDDKRFISKFDIPLNKEIIEMFYKLSDLYYGNKICFNFIYNERMEILSKYNELNESRKIHIDNSIVYCKKFQTPTRIFILLITKKCYGDINLYKYINNNKSEDSSDFSDYSNSSEESENDNESSEESGFRFTGLIPLGFLSLIGIVNNNNNNTDIENNNETNTDNESESELEYTSIEYEDFDEF